VSPDPLSVSCPDCHARKGSPCVYMWPKDWDGSPRVRHEWLSAGVLAVMDRAGTPTVRPHGGRSKKARAKALAARLDAERAAPDAAYAARDAALRANADAVQAEHEALRGWLREHARILF
jgi:hypothetical protein